MGLLDALLSNDSGGGLLSGLPASWQYGLPSEDSFNPYAGIENAAAPSGVAQPLNPFGPVPQIAPPPAPPSVFDTGTAMLPGGALPGAPIFPTSMQGVAAAASATPAPPPAQPVAAASLAPVAPQAGPINTMAIGNYQMPQFGTAADYTPTATIPANAQPTQGAATDAPDQPLPPALGGSAPKNPFLHGLQSVLRGGGIFSAMNGTYNDPKSIAQQNLKSQYDAIRQTLITNGEAPSAASSKAMLAVMNPEAGKTIISEALSNKEKFQATGEDGLGGKTYGFVNERDQTINGKPIGADGSGSGGGLLADGVKKIDSSLQGKDYLDQFSPEVQAAVQNYVDGKSMPTGNPRKGFTQTIKMIAQKYGADTGQSVDDASYVARRTMRNQLSSSSPSSLGGQINIGNTAAGHLADLSEKAVALGNVDTGLAPLSTAVNAVRGLGTEQAAKIDALRGAAQHYGQEITKFYAGSPGGVAERDRFIEQVNGTKDPQRLAEILSTEAELMRSRLTALGGQIQGVLGDEGAKQYPVMRPDGEAGLAKVAENVARLRGGQGPAASSTPAYREGATATNPKTGQTLTFKDGKWQ
jgi:hypothetical protein